ncbi:hypothetical protein EC844_11953 [Acinetobacter calcoaceticus]|uniref:Threonine efflux protein n=1 Tax=Acinetobacter calcoaceticus TaxID=471 RepID=A0A4R1XKJ9_ACICA|nr:hypothetical protein EC844_11953 [Acinetobacter calcoaceticus]
MSSQLHNSALLLLGGFVSGMHLLWFAAVACLFSKPSLRARMLEKQQLINRVIGLILGGLAVLLFAT